VRWGDGEEEANGRVKGIVHPKIKILSFTLFTFVVPNLFVFLFPVEHKRRYFKECWLPDS